MQPFCIAFPVLPGKRDAVKQFSDATFHTRRREFEASEKRLGIPKETWFLQPTPQGDLILVYLEAPDPIKALQEFGRSQDPFDRWFKEEVKAITGVDLNQPPPGPLPAPLGTYGY